MCKSDVSLRSIASVAILRLLWPSVGEVVVAQGLPAAAADPAASVDGGWPRAYQTAIDVEGVYPSAVPNSRPTAAVASMASIPQMVTLTAPTKLGAPPTRAAIDPSATRHKSDTTATMGTNAVGATRMVSTGTPAPTANVAADPNAACSGRAASSSVKPSSSRACAARAPFAISRCATVRASPGSSPRLT